MDDEFDLNPAMRESATDAEAYNTRLTGRIAQHIVQLHELQQQFSDDVAAIVRERHEQIDNHRKMRVDALGRTMDAVETLTLKAIADIELGFVAASVEGGAITPKSFLIGKTVPEFVPLSGSSETGLKTFAFNAGKNGKP